MRKTQGVYDNGPDPPSALRTNRMFYSCIWGSVKFFYDSYSVAYTGDFCMYDRLDKDDEFTREYLVHGDSEYVDQTVQVKYTRITCQQYVDLAASRCLKRITK